MNKDQHLVTGAIPRRVSSDDQPSPAVFLDRDGVLNEMIAEGDGLRPPLHSGELVIAPGAAAALARLSGAGFVLISVSNQPDIARGRTSAAAVETINLKLCERLSLKAVYYCPHDGTECACRKPRDGMIQAAAADHRLDLGGSYLIGDRWVDIAAAGRAGVKSVLLERSYSWASTSAGPPPPRLRPDFTKRDLQSCVEAVLRSAGGK